MSSKAPEYRCWIHIRSRCFNQRNRDFRLYGARGITMHAAWVHDFQAFLAYMGPRPSPQHSIDRINNYGDYEPGNVRWATRQQQTDNRRPKSEWGVPPLAPSDWPQMPQRAPHAPRPARARRPRSHEAGCFKTGEGNVLAKLTPDRVREIRSRSGCGLSHTIVAKEFGVARSTIRRIITGHIWGHVQ